MNRSLLLMSVAALLLATACTRQEAGGSRAGDAQTQDESAYGTADGTATAPDSGAAQQPMPGTTNPDGSVTNPDGSVTQPDGTTTPAPTDTTQTPPSATTGEDSAGTTTTPPTQ